MLNDYISTLAAAFLAVVVVFILNHLSRKFRGRKLPKWVMPAAAGLAMVGYSIWNEYAWFPKIRADLPASVVVVQEVSEAAPWRPWTYLAPLVVRFVAIDTDKIDHPVAARPELARTDLLLVARWRPFAAVPVVYDCDAKARADLIGGGALGGDGTLSGAVWVTLAQDDQGLAAACAKG